MANVATRDDQRALVKLARQGKLDGDEGLRLKLNALIHSGYSLDFSEKPFYRTAVWEAAWKNHEPIVKLLVEKKASMSQPDYEGRTPLHECAFYGHMKLVTWLLDQGHPINCTDHFGQTPLFRAAEANRVEVIDYLVQRKAEMNLLDSDSCTVQHLSGFQGLDNNSDWLLYNGAWKNRFSIEDAGPPKLTTDEEGQTVTHEDKPPE
mmetsp:Transcript_2851/g.4415  ORF Transcript_2851/g.4415 Transcript_2851/m.4415 type:complete len:206 (+) Transcript_2851:80-697(+)